MQASYLSYDYLKSYDRIDEILNTSDNNYEEQDFIPFRDKLTYTNGFYVSCSAMFVDIRGSKKLTEKHKRPTLARIYRCYISETIAIMRSHPRVTEVSIQGDCVWGIFDTKTKQDIDEMAYASYRVSSMVDILNWRLEKKGINPINIGIGIADGRALMIQAGYKGSGINEVVWMGEVVNRACELCSYGNKEYGDYETMISDAVYYNLNDANKRLFTWNAYRGCYNGNVVNISMNDWLEEQKEKYKRSQSNGKYPYKIF